VLRRRVGVADEAGIVGAVACRRRRHPVRRMAVGAEWALARPSRHDPCRLGSDGEHPGVATTAGPLRPGRRNRAGVAAPLPGCVRGETLAWRRCTDGLMERARERRAVDRERQPIAVSSVSVASPPWQRGRPGRRAAAWRLRRPGSVAGPAGGVAVAAGWRR
jgi:hypothetical protein